MDKCIMIEVKLCRINHPKCVHKLMKSTERQTLFLVAMTNHMYIEDRSLSICVGNQSSIIPPDKKSQIDRHSFFLGRHSG